MADPACPSCGVPYADHLGLHGTCAALVEARAMQAAAEAEATRVGRRALRAEAERDTAISERDEARRDLARCWQACGEDCDGNDPENPAGWVHLYQRVPDAVRELRREYDAGLDAAVRGEEAMAEVERLRAALRDVLPTFHEYGHIGDRGECRRSGWMPAERLAELWALAGGEATRV